MVRMASHPEHVVKDEDLWFYKTALRKRKAKKNPAIAKAKINTDLTGRFPTSSNADGWYFQRFCYCRGDIGWNAFQDHSKDTGVLHTKRFIDEFTSLPRGSALSAEPTDHLGGSDEK
jgi:hypothetical protein